MAHNSFCSDGRCACKYAGKVKLEDGRPVIRNMAARPIVPGVKRLPLGTSQTLKSKKG